MLQPVAEGAAEQVELSDAELYGAACMNIRADLKNALGSERPYLTLAVALIIEVVPVIRTVFPLG